MSTYSIAVRVIELHSALRFFNSGLSPSLVACLVLDAVIVGCNATMDQANEVVRHHAILIGIDSYERNPLTSCVRDVEEMSNYLSKMPFPVDIQLFKAPTAKEPSSAPLIEDPKGLPTYRNIKSALKEVTARAQPRDFIYIHFSGHGTRIRPSYHSASKYQYTGDVGLVLLPEANGDKLPTLRGLELSHLIRNMVTKNVIVTLVLDCCFSGGVSRLDDEEIRYLGYDTSFDPDHPLDSKEGFNTEGDDSSDHTVSRDASMLPNWVVDPKGYIIIAACGPGEEAGAIQCEKNKRMYGALSYLLRRTLGEPAAMGMTRTLQEIYEQLFVEFQHHRLQQTPVLYGNGAVQFLGPPVSDAVMIDSIAAIKIDEASSNLRLQAGQAHGVCEGDHFIVEPFYAAEKSWASPAETYRLRARAVRVGPFTSELQMFGQVPNLTSMPSKWIANPWIRLSLQRYPVRLSTRLPDLEKWQEASSKRVSLDIHFTDVVEDHFLFHVVVNPPGRYVIQDAANKLISTLPITSPGSSQAAEQNLDLVERLVRFKHLEKFTNSHPSTNSPFQESFRVELVTPSQKFKPGNEVIEVRHCKEEEDNITLEIHNMGSSTLYVYALNLGPRWQVENIWGGCGEVINAHDPANPWLYSGMTSRALKMTVPDEMIASGHRQCEDILKVFVTTQPTTFTSWQMPEIEQPNRREYSLSQVDQARGGENLEYWVALNFYIRTKLY